MKGCSKEREAPFFFKMIMIIIVIDGGSCYNKLVYYKKGDIYEAQIFCYFIFIDDISDDGLLWRKREHENFRSGFRDS